MRINVSLTVEVDADEWARAHHVANNPALVRDSVRWAVRRAAADVTGDPAISINNGGRAPAVRLRS